MIHGGYDPNFDWFVVTPFYANGTLQQKMDADAPQLTLGAALAITDQVLQGWRDAFTYQQRWLVHFDIKPSNIALDDTGKARIVDWGLANFSDRISIDGTHGYTLWYARLSR
ncbi:protein kinase domain-containing protein [Kibdelosporangium aridum]|uniref:Protein kinase domain-containing protein n=1 Tax=Kibdelosporangium aridum TaxID=2030 RepID=A0A1W2DBL2_KIBAR|nr:protein kinase [Kibdelosporangium aridum]SMC94664.1 Protein kinase domain-containing protein [Kibdelosporangium aridum]